MPLGKVAMSEKTGRPVRTSADGYPEWGFIGFTIAWELITAEVADTELADGTPVAAGGKAIRYGTPLVRLSGGASVGKWVPYNSAGADGAQTLTKGDVGILDMTRTDAEAYSEHVGLITGGGVWRERLVVGGAGQATLVNLLEALPRLEITPRQ